MRDIILVDLDHTVFDSTQRDHMIGKTSWEEYHSCHVNDAPATDVISLIEPMRREGYSIIAVTGRSAPFRASTMRQLAELQISIDELLMRAEKDFRKAGEMKIAMVEEHLGQDWRDRVLFVIDDTDGVVSAFRAAGVTVLQCYNRSYNNA